MSARIGVALCGAVALLVLARTAAYYARTDALALGLVLAMAAALLGAIAELLARVGRASRLAGELAALPRPATSAAVDGSSEPLRSLLRARLAHAGGALGGAPLAGYVVGLLVMLGLLGTFLGLFETLRGAREALTSSGDVDALRASLAAPMLGLTRSFGTSAAGVSASAMLGLAAALARHAEARFGQALATYSAEALAPLTVQMRQLAALERVAAQGEALPRVVSALEGAAARLSSLEGDWRAAQAEAAGAIRDAVERARSDVQRAVIQAVSAAEGALSPLLARAVDGSVAVARQHVIELGARLDADLESRRADEATRACAHEEAFARIAAAEDRRAEGLSSRWADATEAMEAAAAASEAAVFAGEQERAAVETLLAGAAARAEALDVQARQAHASLVAEVQRGVAEHAARAVSLELEVGTALAAQAERLAASMTAHAAEREAQLDAVATSVREAAAGMQAGSAELAAVAEMFASAVDRHREGATEWLAALGTVEGAIARAANEAASAGLAEQLDRARELFDAQLQFHRELLLQLRGIHRTDARRERQDEDVPG